MYNITNKTTQNNQVTVIWVSFKVVTDVVQWLAYYHSFSWKLWAPECTKITLPVINFSMSIYKHPENFQYF